MKLILPKTFVHIGDHRHPFFLLGPVKGGGDWQYRACLELDKQIADPLIVSPCNYEADHPLLKDRVGGSVGEKGFEYQLNWERHYLECASRVGCIIAWLPVEDLNNPRGDGQPYARDTYGELGEWRGKLIFDIDFKLNFVLGAEPGFPGLDVIKCNFSLALEGRPFPIYPTLEERIRAAVNKVEQRIEMTT